MLSKKVRLIFSIISIMLMLPTVYGATPNYDNFYRTFFVFFIDEVVEMFADDSLSLGTLYDYWDLLNQWLGAIVCALAFCMLMDDFKKLLSAYVFHIQCLMLAVVVSSIICAAAKVSIQTLKKKHASNLFNAQFFDD